MISFKVNGTLRDVDVVPSTPLLWVLRDSAKLKGTKYGCGAGLCGACTVHMDGIAMLSAREIYCTTLGSSVLFANSTVWLSVNVFSAAFAVVVKNNKQNTNPNFDGTLAITNPFF